MKKNSKENWLTNQEMEKQGLWPRSGGKFNTSNFFGVALLLKPKIVVLDCILPMLRAADS